MSHYLSTKIVLVRHGLSSYNQQGRHQGCSDVSVLTPAGLTGAQQTGTYLNQNFRFDALYTSPLVRAKQTAKAITQFLENRSNLLTLTDTRLKEVDLFCWEGLTYQEVKCNQADAYQVWQQTPELFSFLRQGESFFPLTELYDRVDMFWQDLLKQHQGQTILIVAHGGTNRALISRALDLSASKYHSLQQSNCGISYLQLADNYPLKPVNLIWFNSTSHLQEKLPKLKEGRQGWRWLLVSDRNSNLNHIFDYLQSELIDSMISHQGELIPNTPPILQLNLDTSTLLNNWQSQISKENSPQLTTALIIADHNALAQFLQDKFKLNNLDLNNLYIVHYPRGRNPGILQGILPLSKSHSLPVVA